MRWLSKKRISILLGILVVGASITLSIWYYRYSSAILYNFVDRRDRAEILDIFDRDWYWLIPGDRDSFSPELMLDYKAPRQNPMYAGRLTIKVLRQRGKLIGFVAYYMKSPQHGFLNFVDVNPEFRSKGFAARMVQHAIDDMTARGAKKISLVTRPANTSARNLYKRLGFKEVRTDDIYVYLERVRD